MKGIVETIGGVVERLALSAGEKRKLERELTAALLEHETLRTERQAATVGEEARGNLSSALLAMTPAYAGAYALIVGRKQFKVTVRSLGNMVQKTVKSLAPMAMLLWMAYSIGALLDYVDCGGPISDWIMSFSLSYFGATVLIIALVLVLTMSLSPNAVMPLFGPMIITIFMNYGVNPLIPAAMLIPMFHGLGQVTIPYATVLYPAMGLAESDFGKTVMQMMWWINS